jgi:inhibitor of cysteine peptidase
MKLKLIAIATLLLVSLSLSSCIITSQLINVDIPCEELRKNPNSIINDFQIEIGDKITVKLCSNPTTGFQWGYEMSGDNAIKEEDHDFEEPNGDVVGASGTEVWTFEGTAEGTTVVLMEYSQPWEGGIKKEWTYRMNITVK